MGIKPQDFYDLLIKNDIKFFTGVPDSLLKEFCLCLDEKINKSNHIIAANEGSAVAIAAGHHIGTGKVPLVYMQNSGLGNAINPLLSLCDKEVYSIPLIMLIGWRGEPNVNDEPQHIKQGKIQLELLKILDIPYVVISKEEDDLNKKIVSIINQARENNKPCAIVVKKKTFLNYGEKNKNISSNLFLREEALEILLNQINDNSIIVSTTGKTSREIFELRKAKKQQHDRDFLTVGSMGHCSSIALGIALSNNKRKVFCIDGDGSMIMHMGVLTTLAQMKPKNFFHILLNNKVHESVGGQETSIKYIDLKPLIKSNSYENFLSIDDKDMLASSFKKFVDSAGPSFIEISIDPGSRENLGRPTESPIKNKVNLMSFIDKSN